MATFPVHLDLEQRLWAHYVGNVVNQLYRPIRRAVLCTLRSRFVSRLLSHTMSEVKRIADALWRASFRPPASIRASVRLLRADGHRVLSLHARFLSSGNVVQWLDLAIEAPKQHHRVIFEMPSASSV